MQFYVEENYLANARSLLAAMRKEKGVKPDAIVANLTGEQASHVPSCTYKHVSIQW